MNQACAPQEAPVLPRQDRDAVSMLGGIRRPLPNVSALHLCFNRLGDTVTLANFGTFPTALAQYSAYEAQPIEQVQECTRVTLENINKRRISYIPSPGEQLLLENLRGAPVDMGHLGLIVDIAENVLQRQLRQEGPGRYIFADTGIQHNGVTQLIDIDAAELQQNFKNEYDRRLEFSFGKPRRWNPDLNTLLQERCFVTGIVIDTDWCRMDVVFEEFDYRVTTTALGAQDPDVTSQVAWERDLLRNRDRADRESPFNPRFRQRYTPKALAFREKMRLNLYPTRRTRGTAVQHPAQNEKAALETLREMVSEKEYRKYLRDGFLNIRGKSGRTYQVFRDKWHTFVWKDNKKVQEVCARLSGRDIPPTDHVIAYKTIIETDEEEFKRLGNVYNMVRAA